MVVLVVDDQTNVVSGIVSGVRWHRLGVQKVLTAYNAFEAKEILEKQQVHLMLCDIEMPAENGLSLLRWAREEGYMLECIFLTSHADFQYTRETIRLGGFDYILQPARYEDIEGAISRAFQKMEKENERLRYASYGQLLYHRKNKVMDSVLKDWYTGKETGLEEIWKDLAMFRVVLKDNSRVHLTLIHVNSWRQGIQPWEAELVRFTMENILEELFERYGQDILLSESKPYRYNILLYEKDGNLIDREGVVRQIELLKDICENRFGMEISCYMGNECLAGQVRERIRELEQLEKDNVENVNRLFFLGEQEQISEEDFSNEMDSWAGFLEKGNFARVKEESIKCLERLARAGKMNARKLKQFFLGYMQVVCSGANYLGISVKDMFADESELDESLKSGESLAGMERFIRLTMDYLDNQMVGRTDEINLVDEMKEYIHANLEKDIRRSDIAEAFYFSQDYLSRVFKKETGMSLKEYMIEAKMQEARLLLQSTTLPVSIIAMKVGYTNFSYFSQFYKKTFDITPTDERKKDDII